MADLAVVLCTASYAVTMSCGGARNGQTLGKQAVGLRVIRDDSKPIGPGLVLWHELLLKVGLSRLVTVRSAAPVPRPRSPGDRSESRR